MFDENSTTTTLHHHNQEPNINLVPLDMNYFCAEESEMSNTMKLDHFATICAMTEPAINIAAVFSIATSTSTTTSSSSIEPESFNLKFQTTSNSTLILTHAHNNNNNNNISTDLEIQRTEETKSPLSSSCSSSIESPSVLSYSTEFVASIFEIAAERCNYEMNCSTYNNTSSDGKALRVSVLNTVGLSCDDCEPSFRSNPRIKWHRRTNDKFCNECTICGGPFIPTEATRKRKRGFGCHRCQAVFDRADRLLAHSRIHTGIKPYGCPYCPRKYSRKDRWSAHIKRQHSN